MLAEKNIMLDLNKPIQSNEAGTTAYFGPLATWDDDENGGYCPDPSDSRGKSEIVNGEEQILPTKYINAYQTYLINNGVNNAVASIPEMPYNCNYQVGSYNDYQGDQTCYEVYEETWDNNGNLIDKKLIKEKAESWYLSTNYWISKLDDYICTGIAVGKDMHNGIWYTNEAGVRPVVTIPTSILK